LTSGRPKEPNLDLKVTLDAVFRRNVLIRPGALAIADPPDRPDFAGNAPRRLNYAEADAAVTKIARQLKSLGLPDQAIVAIQLPNTVESALTLLAVIRAGMIAVPMPLLWRRSDLVTALRDINVRAIITMTHLGDEAHAEVVCEAAAELFTLGFPCAFGADVPDGVIQLDLDAHAPPGERDHLPTPELESAESVAIATFDAARHGPFPVGRNHSQWLAAGLAVLLEARIATGDTIVSTLSIASLAGLAGGFVPWLLSGGALQLVHGFSPQALSAAPDGAHIVAPATALNSLMDRTHERFSSAIGIHRGPESLGIDLSQLNCGAIVDLQVFGEIGVTAMRRIAKVMPSPIPLGPISAPIESESAPTVIETKRLADGTLALRGAMVPDKLFPPNSRSDAAQLEFDIDGFVRTNLRCHAVGGSGLAIESGVEGVIAIGGLRYGVDDLKNRVANASSDAKISTARNALLGARLTIKSTNPSDTTKALDEAGLSSLIIEGVRERPAARRAAS
jgi:hypothetical protein